MYEVEGINVMTGRRNLISGCQFFCWTESMGVYVKGEFGKKMIGEGAIGEKILFHFEQFRQQQSIMVTKERCGKDMAVTAFGLERRLLGM